MCIRTLKLRWDESRHDLESLVFKVERKGTHMPIEHLRGLERNFIGIDDTEMNIYRVFPEYRFTRLVTSRRIALVRPEQWDDPFENFFLKSQRSDAQGNTVSLHNLASKWYGQCWTTNSDSDAMWRIYGHDKHGIKVKTTIRKLFDCFFSQDTACPELKYFIGRVSYRSREHIVNMIREVPFENIAFGGTNEGFASLLCVKREEFEHEKEVRMLFSDVMNSCSGRDFAEFAFDCNSVLEEIVLDPRLSEFDFNRSMEHLRSLGCTIPIEQSPLYQFPSEIYPL